MSFRGLTTGVSGLQSQSQKMEVIGNNLANLSTAGFKRGEVNFQETFHNVIKNAASGSGDLGGTNPMTIGSGVSVATVNNIFSQGARDSTGRTLDFMVEGGDFFVAKNGANGSLMLTRSGSFQFDSNMNLVDSIGNKVQGFNVNKETGSVATEAGDILIDDSSLQPMATTELELKHNIDSSTTEASAVNDSNAWEVFSSGENFGSMGLAIPGGSGSKTVFGSGFYKENHLYTDAAATINVALDTVTLAASPTNLIDGFSVGNTLNLLQGTDQVQRTISAINTGTRAITLSAAAPGTFATGTLTVTNMTNGAATRGTSGSTLAHNDILDSQVTMVDADGKLVASFYRVSGPAGEYTHGTATVAGGGTDLTIGMGEFTNIMELKENIELALRDGQLSNYSASSDLSVTLDKFGKVTFGGTGLVEDFRLVMNADNTEMLDRFTGTAMTDAAAVATTQARVDANGDVIATPALAMGSRSVNASKWWFDTAGLENYGYSGTNQSTEYGEFAGLHLDSGATGTGFGSVQFSITNALGDVKTREFRMVSRDADPTENEFSTMGELSTLVQNTLRTADFSSIAIDGTLQSDQTASANFINGRLSVSTTSGAFNNLTVSAVNSLADPANGVTKSDETNFDTVLGELATGISGKTGQSNRFIQADIKSQSQVYDNLGNEHTSTTYFLRDRSTGLSNIEWKFKAGLNPNLNAFSSESSVQDVYGNTYNSIEDTATNTGVLAFDISSGDVLAGNGAGSDSRYVNSANLTFLPATNSQEADTVDITIDFKNLTSYNGKNTIIGSNLDGYPMGELVRITSEENTGNINGVYSNGKIQTLAKIGLMSISNPEGLQKTGSSYFSQTPNSSANGVAKGLDQIFAVNAQAPASGDSVNSKVHGGALESSNVDLTEELTEMIITQRAYSASGKTITTSDEMLQEALSLKR
jgi:flagellar hook protein FlgE